MDIVSSSCINRHIKCTNKKSIATSLVKSQFWVDHCYGRCYIKFQSNDKSLFMKITILNELSHLYRYPPICKFQSSMFNSVKVKMCTLF